MALKRSRSNRLSDRDLLRALASGDADSAETLVDRYWGTAYRVAFLLLHDREASEEVAQDAMLAAIDSIAAFDLDRPFAPWLNRIAANKAHDRARSELRTPALANEVVPEGIPSDEQLADGLSRRMIPAELMAALAGLAPEFRTPIILRHLLDYEPREIAEIVQAPAATVRTRIHRGLLQLRDSLTNTEDGGTHERVG